LLFGPPYSGGYSNRDYFDSTEGVPILGRGSRGILSGEIDSYGGKRGLSGHGAVCIIKWGVRPDLSLWRGGVHKCRNMSSRITWSLLPCRVPVLRLNQAEGRGRKGKRRVYLAYDRHSQRGGWAREEDHYQKEVPGSKVLHPQCRGDSRERGTKRVLCVISSRKDDKRKRDRESAGKKNGGKGPCQKVGQSSVEITYMRSFPKKPSFRFETREKGWQKMGGK